MRKVSFVVILIVVGLVSLAFNQTATSQSSAVEGPIATTTNFGDSIAWQPRVAYSDAQLTISGPDGVRRQSFGPGADVVLLLTGDDDQVLPKGSYTYELRLAPMLTVEAKRALADAATSEDRERVTAELQETGQLPLRPLVQTGHFSVSNGTIVMGDATEPEDGPSARTTESEAAPQDQVYNEDLHVVTGNTPLLRLEQTSGGGWSPQTWEVAGNEVNFFVRDVLSNSLPFRIRPGAPSSSIDVAANGNVGIGIATPATQLHVAGANASFRVENSTNVLLDLDGNGNLTLHGLLTEASDASLKENFVPVDTASVLEGIVGLDVRTWNYISNDDSVRHMGPVAQEFHASFGLGADNRHIAPLDVNGVTLAGVQEMYRLMQEQEAQIEALQQENNDLNQRLTELEEMVNDLATAQQGQE